ncbi:hypothetical protein QTP86_001849 [Hemibagrus guttatus]|nr:hypothetical protein QTP86_001849 [Hemibagrus guttatus]
MARVAHPDQTCGVPGRMCGMNLVLVRDALVWVDQCRVPLALLSLDQEKAFDHVSHVFLFALLRRMGFGPGFVAMVRLLYAGAVSRVIVNGHCSGLIEQRGGGLHIPGAGGTRAKVSVYTDDVTLFFGRDEDFRAVSGILEAFSDATGAHINRSKSAVLYAGAWAGRSDVPGGFALCQDGLKILVVVFWREDSAQKNWDIALSKLKARAESWCKRVLSLTERVVAACSDLLAGLNHLALVFPILFVTGRRLERALFTFIWGAGVSRFSAQRCARSGRKGEGEWRVSPFKTMAMHVAFLVKGTEGHMASQFARFWIGFALRAVIPWKGTSPWSTDRPWHYQKVAEFIRGHPWCLVDGLVLDHRKLYKRWRDCWAAQSGQTHPQMPWVEWAAMQPTWLDGASKDLHWLGALRRLPVRERLYRHGISPTPLCPIGCGGKETVEHALWSCPVAARFWRRISEWWSAEEGAGIDRDLVLYGRGLKHMGPETANLLWQAVSVAKWVLWGARCECIWSQIPHVRQVDLFHVFRARLGKTMAMHVAFLTKLVRGTEGHMSSLFARFWIGFALRSVIPWKGTSPWSTDRPWHYQKVAEFIRGHPWCLVDGLVLDHWKLYKRYRDCWAAQSGQTHPQMPGVEWAAMQPNWLDGASKDLHWLRALRCLPVRERLYRHGINPTPLCPIGCGGEETVEHALWSCPVAA